MSVNQAPVILLSSTQRKILEGIRKGSHSPWHWIQRSTIILMAADGWNNKEIARQTSWNRNTVKLWRIRFAAVTAELHQIENTKAHALKSTIEAALSDEPRPGAPNRITDEQVARILALACQQPEELGLPYSHWTPGSLAREAISQGIIVSISVRQVGRFLKKYGPEASPEPVLAKSPDRGSRTI